MKELFEKQVAEHLKVEVVVEGSELKAIQSLDLGAVLDKAAAAVKAKIPGNIEEPFVDSIVAQLKAAIGLSPAPAPAQVDGPQ